MTTPNPYSDRLPTVVEVGPGAAPHGAGVHLAGTSALAIARRVLPAVEAERGEAPLAATSATGGRLVRRRKKPVAPTGPRRGAVYARFSTDMQKPTSIERQVEICRAYADANGIEVVAVFVDEERTGATTQGRDQFALLVAMVDDKLLTDVLGEMTDRFSRDVHDMTGFFKKLTHRGVVLHECAGAGGPVDLLSVSMKSILSQTQREQIAFRCAKGRDQATERGILSRMTPFGLMRPTGRGGRVASDPDKAAFVVMIFEKTLQGAGLEEIARCLEGLVPTPADCRAAHRGRRMSGASWNCGMVREIIRNPLHMGVAVDRATRIVHDPDDYYSITLQLQPEDEWIFAEIPECAVVSREVWRAANDIVNARSFGGGRTRASNEYLLNDRVRCACGAKATLTAAEPAHFHCLACGVGPTGFGKLPVAALERLVFDVLRELLDADDGALEEFQAGWRERRDVLRRDYEAQRAALEGVVASRGKTLDRALDETLVDGFSRERVAAWRARLEEELRQARDALDALRPPVEPEDGRLPGLREALAGIDALVPLRGRDGDTGRLCRLVRAGVTGVLVALEAASPVDLGETPSLDPDEAPSVAWEGPSPAPEETSAQVKVTVSVDLQALLVGGSGDVVVRERRLDVAAVARDRREARAAVMLEAHAVGFDAAGGPVPDDTWSLAQGPAAIALPSLSHYGWSARGLVDAVRFRASTTRYAAVPSSHGPTGTFLPALRAFVRSGAFGAVAEALAPTPFAIPRSGYVSRSVVRPSPEAAAMRAELAPSPDDDATTRAYLAAAAMRADGIRRSEALRSLDLRVEAADDAFFAYLGGGAAEVRARARAGSEGARIEAIGPLHEARRIACDLVAGGSPLDQAASATGLAPEVVGRWVQARAEGGDEALRAKAWELRGSGFLPGPLALAAVAELQAFGAMDDGAQARGGLEAAMREGRRLRRDALVRWLDGRPRAEVLGGLSQDEFEIARAMWRAHGAPAFAPGGGLAGGRSRREAEVAGSDEAARRLRLLADHLDGVGAGDLSRLHGVDPSVVVNVVRTWWLRAEAGIPLGEGTATLSAQEVAAVRDAVVAGVDPADGVTPIDIEAIRRMLRERFGLAMTPLAVKGMLVWRGIPVPAAQPRDGAWGRHARAVGEFVAEAVRP